MRKYNNHNNKIQMKTRKSEKTGHIVKKRHHNSVVAQKYEESNSKFDQKQKRICTLTK